MDNLGLIVQIVCLVITWLGVGFMVYFSFVLDSVAKDRTRVMAFILTQDYSNPFEALDKITRMYDELNKVSFWKHTMKRFFRRDPRVLYPFVLQGAFDPSFNPRGEKVATARVNLDLTKPHDKPQVH